MRLVYLYGPPGVGKLTIGRALADQLGYRLFHNHLAVDLAVSIFPRETPEYFDLIRDVRGAGFLAAARANVNLVATGVYRGTEAYHVAMRQMIAPVQKLGGRPLFVQVTCDHDEWLARLQTASRAPQNKLTDPAIALGLMERFDLLSRMPFDPHLTLDTTGIPAAEAARQIAAHLI